MSISKTVTALAVSGGLIFSAAIFAQGEDARELMHERHENFEKMGKAFKRIRDELRSGEASLPVITTSAETINGLARELHTWFPAGTGPASGIETEAKAEIWDNKADFNAKAENLVEESSAFLALTRKGDASEIMGGVRGLGGACKSCHDDYRVDDD